MDLSTKIYFCMEEGCLKQFKFKSHYDRHTLTHTKQRPFDCDTCQKSFRRKDALEIHLRTHTLSEPYPCSELDCPLSFKCKSALRYHKLKEHSKQLNYTCPYQGCEKAFLTLGQLKQHERTSVHQCIRSQDINFSSSSSPSSQAEVLQDQDVFQFSEEDKQIIDTLWSGQKVQFQDEFRYTQNELLKKEICVVVGLMDKITRDDTQVEQKLKLALRILKSEKPSNDFMEESCDFPSFHYEKEQQSSQQQSDQQQRDLQEYEECYSRGNVQKRIKVCEEQQQQQQQQLLDSPCHYGFSENGNFFDNFIQERDASLPQFMFDSLLEFENAQFSQ